MDRLLASLAHFVHLKALFSHSNVYADRCARHSFDIIFDYGFVVPDPRFLPARTLVCEIREVALF